MVEKTCNLDGNYYNREHINKNLQRENMDLFDDGKSKNWSRTGNECT